MILLYKTYLLVCNIRMHFLGVEAESSNRLCDRLITQIIYIDQYNSNSKTGLYILIVNNVHEFLCYNLVLLGNLL